VVAEDVIVSLKTRITMQAKHKKAIGVITVLLTITGGYLLYRYFKNSRQTKQFNDLPDSLPATAASRPAKAPGASTFPLKQGSPKNDLVKQLQGYLGVVADGVWGPKTQSAFVAKTGKTQIATQAEFDQVITALQANASKAANQARADDLTKQWNANTNLQLMAGPKRAYYFGVSKDAYGALNLNEDNGSFAPNEKISRTDAKPMGATTVGLLLFQKNNGKLYKVNSNAMTIG
jgi:hypothetical protein